MPFQPCALGVGVSTSNVLEILVVVVACFGISGSPFSISFSWPGLVRRPAGGEPRRTPVRRFWRFVAGRSAVERPVRRRDARRRDWRTSHWRFFASQKRTAEETARGVNTCVTSYLQQRELTSKNDYEADDDDNGYQAAFGEREAAFLRACCAGIAGVHGVVLAAIVPRVRRLSGCVCVLRRRRILSNGRLCKHKERQQPVCSRSPGHCNSEWCGAGQYTGCNGVRWYEGTPQSRAGVRGIECPHISAPAPLYLRPLVCPRRVLRGRLAMLPV
jgi:hypothetical protein